MVTRGSVVAVLLLLAGVASAQSQAQLTLVEGYVFNKHTGVLLEDARIDVLGPGTLLRFFPTLLTDSNGFYSLWVDIPALDGLRATCRFAGARGRTVVRTSEIDLPADPRPLVRRDLYVDALRRRGFSRCE